MLQCKKKNCKIKDSCNHSKKHLPKDGLELTCIFGTVFRNHKVQSKNVCPGCTWVGKGKNPYENPEVFINKARRRNLWTPTSSPGGIKDLAETIDVGKETNIILKEEGILV